MQWKCETLKSVISKMVADQEWQVSMGNRRAQYILLQQIFETGTEMIQGHTPTHPLSHT